VTTPIIRPNAQGVFPRVINGPHQLALGNMTQFSILVYRSNGTLHLGIEGKGCYCFGIAADKAYVAEKLGLTFTGDAANVADFINDQLTKMPAPRQGQYEEGLCT
jgi:hypothetical protein